MTRPATATFTTSVRHPVEPGLIHLGEVVALTILAIALIPVAYFYSKSLQSVEEASVRTRALMLHRML